MVRGLGAMLDQKNLDTIFWENGAGLGPTLVDLVDVLQFKDLGEDRLADEGHVLEGTRRPIALGVAYVKPVDRQGVR